MVVEKHSKTVSEYPGVLISHNILQMKKHNHKPKNVNNNSLNKSGTTAKSFQKRTQGGKWGKKKHMNISIVNKILTVKARLMVQNLAGRIVGSQEARIIL